MTKIVRTLAPVMLVIILLSCSTNPPIPVISSPISSTPKPPSTDVYRSNSLSLYLGPEVPEALIEKSHGWGYPLVENINRANIFLEMASPNNKFSILANATWIYALVAPFPTITDEISLDELRAIWHGFPTEPLANKTIFMTSATENAMVALLGDSRYRQVEIVSADELVNKIWEQDAWGIVSFEALEPKLKVISIDGQSPIRNDFNSSNYPLKIDFVLRTNGQLSKMPKLDLPTSNREPKKLTTIILTGVTALVRGTAYMMETKGVTYPGRDIREFMQAADITHISNEIPFYVGCDFPNPSRSKLVFCSDPKYIELLDQIGADVVELTGNHFADYGPEAMLKTLEIYNQHNIAYYGGGLDLADAQKPLLMDHNNNKIAFIGCNSVDLGRPPVATENKPGAAPCDHQYLVDTIEDLKAQGYIVITTFQHQEYYSPEARPGQLEDFHRVADAGASIVSGSQAHYAQVMEFYGDAFIHYGLGNLFFDQMGDIPYYPGIRREFIDRYTIYDGRLISVELLTMMLVDYARPRPMSPDERALFLNEYFTHSGWDEILPTSSPQPTLTLTPMSLPAPFTTITPGPR